MKRLYYLFRGTDFARSISRDLQAAGIEEGRLHFMSKDQAALQSAQVHTTSIFDEKDIPHSGTYGAFIGLGAGALFGFYLLASELGAQMTFSLFIFVCALFTFFGAWAGGFIGISHDNHHVARFHDALEQGDTLLMLDTYDSKEETELKQIMHCKHLEASYEGEEENFKVFL
jgi:hypothetical protein